MKVLIIDDHPIVISGCRAMLADQAMELIEARTAKAGRALFEETSPDATIIDINLPDASGFDLAREFLTLSKDARILMLSMNDDSVFVREAIAIGARGFVSKNDDPRLLATALRTVAEGGTFLPAGAAGKVAALIGEGGRLTRREIEIVRQLSEGKSLAEIAVALDVSYKTATQSCNSARTKLEARTPAEMVRRAVELKLV